MPLYVGLKLMNMRVKTIIQKLFLLCISISYDRCLYICHNIAVYMLEKFDNDCVFTGNSRKNLFTVIAKDNIHKGRATVPWGKYDYNAIFVK